MIDKIMCGGPKKSPPNFIAVQIISSGSSFWSGIFTSCVIFLLSREELIINRIQNISGHYTD